MLFIGLKFTCTKYSVLQNVRNLLLQFTHFLFNVYCKLILDVFSACGTNYKEKIKMILIISLTKIIITVYQNYDIQGFLHLTPFNIRK